MLPIPPQLKNSTAILVFANSPKEEQRHKYFQLGLPLFDTLTTEALAKTKETGLPVFHFDERQQVGETFGQRFSNALESIFESGFDQIIAIGNDTPHLQKEHLCEAKKALDEGKTVLGPSLDGGFYLLGIHKYNFSAEVFLNLPWKRFNLFQCISRLLKKQSAVHRLETLCDLDSEKDIQQVLNAGGSLSYSIQTILKRILGNTLAFQDSAKPSFVTTFLPHHFNKGSPRPSFWEPSCRKAILEQATTHCNEIPTMGRNDAFYGIVPCTDYHNG